MRNITEDTQRKFKETVQKLKEKFLANINTNPVLKSDLDKRYYAGIIELYSEHPKQYIKMLLSKGHKLTPKILKTSEFEDVVKWIYEKTSFLIDTDDFKYSLQTRLFHIVNGKVGFEKCHHDGCDHNLCEKKQHKIGDDFPGFCSVRCQANDQSTYEKKRATSRANYGTDHPAQSNIVQEKMAKTTEERYGDRYIFKTDYFKKKSKQTRLERYDDPNYNNSKKNRETFKRHKEEDPNFLKRIQEKTQATKLKNHGDPNFVNSEKANQTRKLKNNGKLKSDEEIQKMKDTFKRNHNGLTSSFQLETSKETKRKTNQEKYGADEFLASSTAKKKIKKTVMRKYHVDHVWKCREIIEKGKATKLERHGTLGVVVRYLYKGLKFDSSWELALWIWCEDHNVKISRPLEFFTFTTRGKTLKYFPDFIVDGVLVEIKGDQFFDSNGNLQNPYDHQLDDVYLAKQKCMVENHVKVLRNRDIMKYVNYIKETYGKNYLKSFQKKKSERKTRRKKNK